MPEGRHHPPASEVPVTPWRLSLLPVAAIAIGAVHGGLSLVQYGSPAAALSIGVMGSIVALLALSISIGYEVIRRRKSQGQSALFSRVRAVGSLAGYLGPILMGSMAAASYFGRGDPLLPSIAIATLAMAVSLIVMVPVMLWLLPRVDPRFR